MAIRPAGVPDIPPARRRFGPETSVYTHDLGMPPIIPKSGVLDGGFGAKLATRGGYVRGPGGPNRHDRGPIWGLPVVRKSADPGGEISNRD